MQGPDRVRSVVCERPVSRGRRVGIRILGTVQGVGFRPFVYRLARAHGLGGWVRNDGDGVAAEVEGAAADVHRFLARIVREAPPLAVVARVATRELTPCGDRDFAVVPSATAGARSTAIAADAATCAECLRELFDPADRRFRYPFINCTGCGPRFTIVEAVPWDRAGTTMAAFTMCAACRAEYEDPAARRFHAEPNACPACGPRLRLVDGGGRPVAGDPLAVAAAALRGGATVAVKGLGGFHLACRADDAGAVGRLRERKRRAGKPLAVMVADLPAAHRLAVLDAEEVRALSGRARPIVLVRRRPGACVAPDVAAGPDLGVMLPYTPLHHLLLADVGTTLVMTSGNLSDEPIVHGDGEAVERLGGIADLLLLHDRPIAARADDSIVRVVRGPGGRHPQVLRRSRGWVPRPIRLPVRAPMPVLAVGGELKGACALVRGREAFLTPHLGDLGDERAYRAFCEAIEHLGRLVGVEPAVVAHDLHPGYRATAWATARTDVEPIGVQHHHAHVASCLVDNGLDAPVIGVAWDGTGLGSDGTIWGGEFLVGDLARAERVAHLEAVPLPGGDAAVREPWRMAAAFVALAYGDVPERLDLVPAVDRAAWRVLSRAVAQGLNAPRTSSAGRLFDAVAAILGLRSHVTFEAQAAMELEALAAPEADRAYPVRRDGGVVRTTDVVRGVVEDLLAGTPRDRIAARFHATLAEVIADVATDVRQRTGIARAALTGGVFQNGWLLGAAAGRLAARGFRVLVHRRVPPNDGGLAVGQGAVAARRLGGRG